MCRGVYEIVLLAFFQLEDKITCDKARVTSTLERLAQQVAQDKEERAKKCKAFKVRWVLLSHKWMNGWMDGCHTNVCISSSI